MTERITSQSESGALGTLVVLGMLLAVGMLVDTSTADCIPAWCISPLRYTART
ncbi:hypothetical protein N657DRAFT_642323 [Parathielavia appendiculata]|uniref:Uncharacterized protein n=1 Tax=Parathielavia appendiculata TaxID=2587402 RepID=A0AAN6U335_9PEZI|nr:hypothetical protein N657DRAFT_642323 [Parathielavia appendiculata]